MFFCFNTHKSVCWWCFYDYPSRTPFLTTSIFSAFSLKLPLHEVSLCFTSKSFPLLFASVGRVQDGPVCSLTDSVSQHGRSQCVPGTVLLSTEQMRLFLELHKDSNKLKYKKEESRPRGTRLPPRFP